MAYNLLSSRIKNVNLLIKKIYFSSDKVKNNLLSFKIKNVNLTIKKIHLSLDKVNYKNVNFIL